MTREQEVNYFTTFCTTDKTTVRHFSEVFLPKMRAELYELVDLNRDSDGMFDEDVENLQSLIRCGEQRLASIDN